MKLLEIARPEVGDFGDQHRGFSRIALRACTVSKFAAEKECTWIGDVSRARVNPQELAVGLSKARGAIVIMIHAPVLCIAAS